MSNELLVISEISKKKVILVPTLKPATLKVKLIRFLAQKLERGGH